MIFVIVRTPWPTSKGLDHPYLHVYPCSLLWFMFVLASLVLRFATLDALSRFVVVWLHSTPMRLCSDVTIWDASPWCRLLCAYLSPFSFHAMVCLPCLFVSSIGLICIFTCLLTCHAWVLLARVSSMLQHNEVMDIQSKPTFVHRGHHLLFTFLLVCFLSCFFSCHVYHAYLLYASFICFLHLFPSISCLSVSCLYLCMYTYGVRMLRARAQSPRRKQKGRRREHVEISQAVIFSRFRSLAFFLPFSIRWFLFGISCHVPFFLIYRVWRPLFIFLHLHFRPCSRDVGIYFLALRACIVHDVFIYILACPFWCDCHSLCHLRQSDA